MKDILLYIPLSNCHRLPIMQVFAKSEIAKGNKVSILVETVTPVCISENVLSLNHQALIDKIDLSIFQRVFICGPNLLKVFFLLKRKGSIEQYAKRRFEVKKLVLDRYNFDCIYVWNGNFPYQFDFLNYAANRKVAINYMEVGWFDQENTYYTDASGVNYKSNIAKTFVDSQKYYEKGALFSEEYKRTKFRGKSTSDDYILVPLQVESDSNITLFSPFKKMEHFIQFLSGWLPPHSRVIVRAHPKSNLRKFSLPSGYEWSSENNLFEDIRRAKFVVGINSTVLLQSLVLGKAVVAFGNGIWGANPALGYADLNSKYNPPKYKHKDAMGLIGYLLSHQSNYSRDIFKTQNLKIRLKNILYLMLGGVDK